MNFTIRTIDHKKQPYDTCGNYFRSQKAIQIKVSKMQDDDYEFLVGLHELIESYLCYQRNIVFSHIDEFDKKFEEKRKKGNTDEPGDNPKAPYFKEHQIATKIERVIAKELGVNWKKYEETINNL